MNDVTSTKDKAHSREPIAIAQDTNIKLIRFIKKMKFGERTHSSITELKPSQQQVIISNTYGLYI